MGYPWTTLYVGTYTGSGSEGIYAFRFDSEKASAVPLGCVARTSNPSTLYRARRAEILYAVDETTGTSKADGAVLAYRIDARAGTSELASLVSSFGVGPCYLATDSPEEHIFTANFHSGSLSCIRLHKDGTLDGATSRIQLNGSSVDPVRQRSSHPHAILPSSDGKHVIVTDLGADELLIFGFDAPRGILSEEPVGRVRFTPGSGPRHAAIHPSGKVLYVIHEIKSIITVHPFGGPDVVGPAVQTIATVSPGTPDPADGADILIDPSGSFLYATVRQTSTIRLYKVKNKKGELEVIADANSIGMTPQAICLSPDARWLLVANFDSSTVDIFSHAEGHLSHIKALSVPSPSSVCFG